MRMASASREDAHRRLKFERSETISEHEASKPKCPKCGSKKLSYIPGNVFVVTSKKS